MFKAVIFDYDDTICLTEEPAFIMENKIAKVMGLASVSRAVHINTWGKPLREALPERFPGADVDEFMKREAQAIENAVQDGFIDKIPNQNLETMERLKKAGKKLAIVTSRNTNEARHLMDNSHPFSSLIEAFYHKDNSKYLKPDPRVFDEILNLFGVTAQESVYVGDSLGDAIAAKSAGLSFIAVLEKL